METLIPSGSRGEIVVRGWRGLAIQCHLIFGVLSFVFSFRNFSSTIVCVDLELVELETVDLLFFFSFLRLVINNFLFTNSKELFRNNIINNIINL